MGKLNWNKATKRETQAAKPKGERIPLRGGSHVKPDKVRHWKDMTPAERDRVMAQIRPPGVRE